MTHDESRKTKLVFSAILLTFAQGSSWDHSSLYVSYQQAIFGQLQDLIFYVWEHAMSDLLWFLPELSDGGGAGCR